jgi:DNA-binding beta-propeller fold protein YncE
MTSRRLLQVGTRASTVLAVISAVLGTAPVAGLAQGPGYAITKHYQIPGDGGWDYLAFDTAAHRLFITRGTHVQVVNPDNGTVTADIPNTPHVHGVALAYELGRGFITAAGDTSIHIFDLKTLQPIGTVKVDADDDAILYDPYTKYVVSMNGDAHSASVVDGTTGKLLKSIPLPGAPEYAVTDNHGTVFANIEDKSLVVVIDLKSLKVVRQWPLAPCESPSGLAIDRVHHRLFSGCHNQKMAISDADAGQVITTVPIGARVDANRYDPGTGLAFSSNGDGTLTVVHEDSPSHFTVLGTVTTELGARTMALDFKTHTIYLFTAKFQPAAANQRPQPVPGSFTLLVAEKSSSR